MNGRKLPAMHQAIVLHRYQSQTCLSDRRPHSFIKTSAHVLGRQKLDWGADLQVKSKVGNYCLGGELFGYDVILGDLSSPDHRPPCARPPDAWSSRHAAHL